jgi:Leucine-rich repeat (LRR) protein
MGTTGGYSDNINRSPLSIDEEGDEGDDDYGRNGYHDDDSDIQDVQLHDQLPPAWEEYRTQQAGLHHGIPSNNWRQQRRKRYLCRCGLPVLAVILLISVASKMAASGKLRGNKIVFDDFMSARAAQVASLVTQQGWSEPNKVATMGSPQWQATQWLGELDPFELDLNEIEQSLSASDDSNSSNIDNECDETAARLLEFQQRYVLAVVYYALNGANWWYDLSFLSDSGICTWNQVWQKSDEAMTAASSGAPFTRVGVDCLDGNRNQIKALLLPANNLEGQVPSEIGLLTALEDINLYGNFVSGILPDSMAALTMLHSVSLHNNTLTGKLPTWLLGTTLSLLTSLNLAHNQFTGEIPASKLSQMTPLHTLNLGNNALSVADINDFAKSVSVQNMPALRNLFLQSNRIYGKLERDTVATHWEGVEILDLSDNFIGGPIPDTLLRLSSLTVLDLHGNDLTGALPLLDVDTGSSASSSLKFLALHDNSLTSAIPTQIGALFSDTLVHLDLSQNKFDAAIPTEIYQLTNLVYLFLAYNDFEPGDIPDEIAALTDLVDFSLKETHRNGTIPDVIGKSLTKLVLLDLDGNDMIGKIPSSLGDLEQLRFLFLSHNLLIGQIPTSLGQLTKLQSLLLQSNQLTGNSPDALCTPPRGAAASTQTVDNLDVFMTDCVHSSPTTSSPFNNPIADVEVTCSCCTVCCEDSETDSEVCNAHSWYAEVDPIWETRYTRTAYLFREEDLEFPALP